MEFGSLMKDLAALRANNPFANDVMDQVDRILASRNFERLQQHAKEALAYLVANKLLGREIKEVTIAIDVWGETAEAYNPTENNKVRTALRDLRNRLKSWDAGEGRNEPIQILIPERTYLPEINERRPKVAVIAFCNWNPREAQDHLCTAVRDEIIHWLSHSGVIQATASTPEAAENQRFSHTLRGSLETHDHLIRLNVSLSDNGIMKAVFGKSFEGGRDDLLKLARRVADEIMPKIRAVNGHNGWPDHKPERFEALALYQRGLWHLKRRTAPDILKSISLFEQAIDANRDFVLAYSGLADALLVLSWYKPATPDRVSFDTAKAHALSAYALNPHLPQVMTSLGYAKLLCDFDWVGAEEDLRQAIRLGDTYAPAHHWLGNLLVMQGRFDEAEKETRAAFNLDRGSIVIRKNLGDPFYYSKRYKQAIDAYRATLKIDSTFWMAHFFLGLSYEQAGDFEGALGEFQSIAETDGVGSVLEGAIAHVYAVSGRQEEARLILKRLQEHPELSYVAPHTLAVVCAGLGDHDRAFAHLGACYENRVELVSWIKVDPRFEGLREDPRFDRFLKVIGLPSGAS